MRRQLGVRARMIRQPSDPSLAGRPVPASRSGASASGFAKLRSPEVAVRTDLALPGGCRHRRRLGRLALLLVTFEAQKR